MREHTNVDQTKPNATQIRRTFRAQRVRANVQENGNAKLNLHFTQQKEGETNKCVAQRNGVGQNV